MSLYYFSIVINKYIIMMNKTENNNYTVYNLETGITMGDMMEIITSTNTENVEVSYEDVNGEDIMYATSCKIKEGKIYIYNEDAKETYTGKDFVNIEMPEELRNAKLMIRNEDICRIYDDFRIVTEVVIYKNKKSGNFSAIMLSNNN